MSNEQIQLTEQQQLKDEAHRKLQEAVKAIHAWACSEDVGPKRTYAFNLYEIARTAPREANYD